ncbi:MAG: hypothetical protein ACJ71Z_14080 [Aeromicrobium sp.]
MNSDAWFILIYSTTDAETQNRLAAELQSLGRLVVQTERRGREHFVLIETAGDVAALTVHELVMSIDPDAELIDTHDGSQVNGTKHGEAAVRLPVGRRTISLARSAVPVD